MSGRIVRAMLVLGALGCIPGAAGAQPAAAPVPTFTKDVAPILQRACQSCHRTGSIGPMSLISYEEVRPWTRSIRARISRREMPPWHVDRTVGIQKFKDDPSLSDREIATIVAWIDGGMPRGNPADMPRPRVFADAEWWNIGTPDLIVTLPEEVVVAPAGPDWWANIEADTGLTEDRYIKAVEVKPGPGAAIKVVHHAVASIVTTDGSPTGGTLVEYAVGKNGDIYPDGAARLIKAGAGINFNMHYHSVGEEVRDRTRLGIVFYPKGYVPKHVMRTIIITNSDDLDIPAGADDVRTDAYFKLDQHSRLVGFMPHMHNRGKRQCLEAIYPNMAVEQLNCVNYDFRWQIVYNYADAAAPLLPAGTILHVTSWHDNSAANRSNPDPLNWVGFGQRTTDDMARHWLTFYPMSDDEFRAQVTERLAGQKQATEGQGQP